MVKLMNLNFKTAIEFTLPWEVGKDRNGNLREDGGYTNDPDDPGGETKWGIAKKYHPDVDIANLTLPDAMAIYQKEYWDIYTKQNPALNLDTSLRDMACVVFDAGVNLGVARSHYWYIQSLKEKDPVLAHLGLRKQFYLDKHNAKYEHGWIARVNDLTKLVEIIRTEST